MSAEPLTDGLGRVRPPHWLWLRSRLAYVAVNRIRDIWHIASGRHSLHSAWNDGVFEGSRREYHRTVVMGGR